MPSQNSLSAHFKYWISSTISLLNSHRFHLLSFYLSVVWPVKILVSNSEEVISYNMIIYYSVYLKYIAFALFVLALPVVALVVLKILQKFTVGRVSSLVCLKGKTAIVTGGGSGNIFSLLTIIFPWSNTLEIYFYLLYQYRVVNISFSENLFSKTTTLILFYQLSFRT